MVDKRPLQARVFTPSDVERARREGKVYDPSIVDFVPFEVSDELAVLLKGAGWKPPKANSR